jgi:hypothetical protein
MYIQYLPTAVTVEKYGLSMTKEASPNSDPAPKKRASSSILALVIPSEYEDMSRLLS